MPSTIRVNVFTSGFRPEGSIAGGLTRLAPADTLPAPCLNSHANQVRVARRVTQGRLADRWRPSALRADCAGGDGQRRAGCANCAPAKGRSATAPAFGDLTRLGVQLMSRRVLLSKRTNLIDCRQSQAAPIMIPNPPKATKSVTLRRLAGFCLNCSGRHRRQVADWSQQTHRDKIQTLFVESGRCDRN